MYTRRVVGYVFSATVHPGVQTLTDGGQCTANFAFYDGGSSIGSRLFSLQPPNT